MLCCLWYDGAGLGGPDGFWIRGFCIPTQVQVSSAPGVDPPLVLLHRSDDPLAQVQTLEAEDVSWLLRCLPSGLRGGCCSLEAEDDALGSAVAGRAPRSPGWGGACPPVPPTGPFMASS